MATRQERVTLLGKDVLFVAFSRDGKASAKGLKAPIICTPEELLEAQP